MLSELGAEVNPDNLPTSASFHIELASVPHSYMLRGLSPSNAQTPSRRTARGKIVAVSGDNA
jgi:hypothetical protein